MHRYSIIAVHFLGGSEPTHADRAPSAFGSEVFVLLDPPKNGNCKFSATSNQLAANIETPRIRSADSIRREVADLLSEQPYSLSGNHSRDFVFPVTDWDTYLLRLRSNGTFGDSITLSTISQLYTVQIVVLSTLGFNSTRVFLPSIDSYDPALPVIMLGHFAEGKGDHYVSLKATNNDSMANIVNRAFKVKNSCHTGSISSNKPTSESAAFDGLKEGLGFGT